MANYDAAYQQARAANEQRYGDILAGYDQRYQRGMQNLQGMGEAQSQQINQQYQQLGAHQNQDLASRGLGNTTAVQAAGRGVEADRQKAQGALWESLRQQRLTTDAGLSGDTLGFKERRSDVYPDPQMAAQLGLAQGAMNAAQKANIPAGGASASFQGPRGGGGGMGGIGGGGGFGSSNGYQGIDTSGFGAMAQGRIGVGGGGPVSIDTGAGSMGLFGTINDIGNAYANQGDQSNPYGYATSSRGPAFSSPGWENQIGDAYNNMTQPAVKSQGSTEGVSPALVAEGWRMNDAGYLYNPGLGQS